MNNLQQKGKWNYILKITLLGAFLSVLCFFFLIDTKSSKDNLIEFYTIFIGIGIFFGGIFGFFFGLFLWYSSVAPKQIKEDSNKKRNLTKKQKIVYKIWDICLSLFAPVVFIVFYLSIFLSDSGSEKYNIVYISAYIGFIGFWITSFILGIYQIILKMKRQKTKVPLIFKIILTLFAICTLIAICTYYIIYKNYF